MRFPIWTENKAKLIQRYLLYFVYITKHGVYIDGFAGPQEPEKPDLWAARLVLETYPRWFRQFHLFEIDKKKVAQIRTLVDGQPPRDKAKREPKRTVTIYSGDCNEHIPKLLASGTISQKEATFALLDQRTFECKWSTVEHLARYKTHERKIELFYFLPNSWLDRAIAAQKDTSVIEAWWGRSDWNQLRELRSAERRDAFMKRLKEDLGYASVKPWPIRERSDGGRIMYYMLHATDHPEAPKQMQRAYRNAVEPIPTPEQIALELGTASPPPF